MDLNEYVNNTLSPFLNEGGPRKPKSLTESEKKVLKNTINFDVRASKAFELDYLNSPKFKERAKKAGYDYDKIKSDLLNSINTQKVNFYDDAINKTGGAYYSSEDNSVNFAIPYGNRGFKETSDYLNSDVVAHEVGHQFSNPEIGMDKQFGFINSNNMNYPKGFLDSVGFKLGSKFNPNHYSDNHESYPQEVVADVHSLRFDLLKDIGFNAGESNLTEEAYKYIVDKSKSNPDSAAYRLMNKIGKENNKELINTYYKEIIEGKTPSKDLNKQFEKARKENKKFLFDIMNRIVSTSQTNSSDFYS